MLQFPNPLRVPRRSLTDIEVAVMGRFLQRALAGLQEAWAKVCRVEPYLLAVETNPMLLKAGLASEQTVRIIVRVQVGEQRGHLQLGYPLPMLEPILDRLSQRTWYGQSGRGGNTVSARMVSALDDVEVTVAAVLGRVPVNCRELLALAPGWVLRLDHARCTGGTAGGGASAVPGTALPGGAAPGGTGAGANFSR